jgi:exoribonuclease-2
MYSQVTSPLRRYSDLVAHEQLRAFLAGRPLIDKNVMLERISAGDEASSAGRRAERNSNLHWTLVYLLQNPEWTGEAVCVELRGKQAVFVIPSIALETVMTPDIPVSLNSSVPVKAGAVDIPNLGVTFIQMPS